MKYNPNIHHRKSTRVKEYDYSQTGLYFITICTQNHHYLFGEIKNDQMLLNNAGVHANQCWADIPQHFPNVKLHEQVVMPNHVHGILEIVGANNYSPSIPQRRSPSRTIGSIIRGYKIGVTKWFRTNFKNKFPVGKNVWQRNHWDHIIRNDNDYLEISQYIQNNPLTWNNDKLNRSGE